MPLRTDLGSVLRQALAGDLTEGWIYLPPDEPWTASSGCLLVMDEEMDCDDDELETKTAGAGFPIEGLDAGTLESVAQWVLQFDRSPSDELLLESFVYYHRFDAFLPAPGAPDPPPWTEIKARLDREFYESLGEERPSVPCKEHGCSRGAIYPGALCRRHHFENVKGEPCPFE